MATLHATGFPPPERWSAAMLADAMTQPGAIVLREPDAFLLGRVAAGEAELHTLVVDPARRRSGIARRLLADFAARARGDGATEAFLEVAEGNAPARALYAGAGWAPVGRRRGYYGGDDALILRIAL